MTINFNITSDLQLCPAGEALVWSLAALAVVCTLWVILKMVKEVV